MTLATPTTPDLDAPDTVPAVRPLDACRPLGARLATLDYVDGQLEVRRVPSFTRLPRPVSHRPGSLRSPGQRPAQAVAAITVDVCGGCGRLRPLYGAVCHACEMMGRRPVPPAPEPAPVLSLHEPRGVPAWLMIWYRLCRFFAAPSWLPPHSCSAA